MKTKSEFFKPYVAPMIMRTIGTPLHKKSPEQHKGILAGDHHRWYIVLLVSCSPAELTSSSDVRREDRSDRDTAQMDKRVVLYLSSNPGMPGCVFSPLSTIWSIIPLYRYHRTAQSHSTVEDVSLNYPEFCPIHGGKLNLRRQRASHSFLL